MLDSGKTLLNYWTDVQKQQQLKQVPFLKIQELLTLKWKVKVLEG